MTTKATDQQAGKESVKTSRRRKRILAVASGGGHWVQLRRLAPAFDDHDVAYLTTEPSYRSEVAPARFYTVKDASRWNKFGLLRQAFQILWILLRLRPETIITTGAAPGFFAVRMGKWLGARCVWLDSIANAEKLSLSGERAGPVADLWLTQWEHLASQDGPKCRGSVL
ncbi:MAG: UDP-N-acetylglucosamine--LPS N-acetylglucosamine transferase [Planctomycetota bacterium]